MNPMSIILLRDYVADKSGKILNPGEKLEFNQLSFELIKKIRQKMVQFRIFDENGEFGLKKDSK